MTEETTKDEAMPLTSSGAKESYSSVDLLDEGSTDGSSPILTQPDTEPQISPSSSKKSKGRRGIKMNARSTMGVEQLIQRSILMHSLAAEFFQCRHFWLFEFQQGLLTMVSSILAFVATTELVENRMKIILTTVVGGTTIFVGFLQAMNSLCSYGTRAIMHQSVIIDLRDQKNHLRMLRVKLGYVEAGQIPAEDTFVDEEDEDEYNEGTFESIEDRFEQSLSGCKSTIPVEIGEAFFGLETSLYGTGTMSSRKIYLDHYGPKYPWEMLGFKPDDIVHKEIMDYPLFPFFLPSPSKVVKNSRERFRKELKEDWEFYSNA